ncbi:Probable tetraacyldisaccharide 4'-kinase, mitochondrial [Galdieria sulphuraria]|nr:Probable tetraacyldisaccharide 4'-kinase, mitochondrial [Galdieria sulphuraria]
MWLWFIRKKRECLKWFLERQLKSPKNSSFAGFYKQPLVENTQQSLHVRVVDSLLSLCSYLYLFVSFGNYTWGGTGKTPFVMFLSKLLVSRGYQPVILSRGYGHKDEAKMMIRQGLAIEVLTGSNREEAFQKVFSSVVSSSTMVVILDDGLQHWRLKRQVNVLMVNAALAFGVNGYFIPRGSLREPPCEAASRSTCIVLHHCNQVSDFQLQQLKAWFQMQCPEKPILTSFMISLQTRMLSYVVE